MFSLLLFRTTGKRSIDGEVKFWDAGSAEMLCMLQGHKDGVYSIDLSPTGGLLATGSRGHAMICKLSNVLCPLLLLSFGFCFAGSIAL